MLQIKYLAAALLLTCVYGDDTHGDTCDAPQPWEAVIEDWATAARGNLTRHGRIMSLPPSQGYYVTDRIDLVPPPPPRPHHAPPGQLHRRGPYPMPGQHHPPGPPSGNYNHAPSQQQLTYQLSPQNHGPSGAQSGPPSGGQSHGPPSGGPSHGPPSGSSNHGPPSGSSNHGPSSGAPNEYSQGQQGPMPYDEWQATPPPPPGAGKIVNRPPNPYKDQFKPSYPPPSNQPIPVSADRVDAAPPSPQKQVSETDLYLLRAIEKLVYRVDLMEKRMRKMEENMHYIVVGAEAKPEPCPENFTRVGEGCYHFSSEAANWKGASFACRKLKGFLLELDNDEKRRFTLGVQANKKLKGADFWTGGLNPGLLWIWAHSAKPVAANSTSADHQAATIVGEGRCLALIAAPATADYVYRGQDCALKHRYVCEREEDKGKLSNEIERVARNMREKRKPKIARTGTDAGLF